MKKRMLKKFRETEKAVLIEASLFFGTNRFYKTTKFWVPKSCLEMYEVEDINGKHEEEAMKAWFAEKKLDELEQQFGNYSWIEYTYEEQNNEGC